MTYGTFDDAYTKLGADPFFRAIGQAIDGCLKVRPVEFKSAMTGLSESSSVIGVFLSS